MSVDALLHDVRYALRSLGRARGFTTATVLALTLGVGATTALFAVLWAVLLRPLPYRSPDRLVTILHGDAVSAPVSPADYLDFRQHAHSFAGMAAAQSWGANLASDGRAERIPALQVTGGLFDVLGVGAEMDVPSRPETTRRGEATRRDLARPVDTAIRRGRGDRRTARPVERRAVHHRRGNAALVSFRAILANSGRALGAAGARRAAIRSQRPVAAPDRAAGRWRLGGAGTKRDGRHHRAAGARVSGHQRGSDHRRDDARREGGGQRASCRAGAVRPGVRRAAHRVRQRRNGRWHGPRAAAASWRCAPRSAPVADG
jgi:hypothetical protein